MKIYFGGRPTSDSPSQKWVPQVSIRDLGHPFLFLSTPGPSAWAIFPRSGNQPIPEKQKTEASNHSHHSPERRTHNARML